MTANSLEENPANHANSKTVNINKLFHPEGLETDVSANFLVTIFY